MTQADVNAGGDLFAEMLADSMGDERRKYVEKIAPFHEDKGIASTLDRRSQDFKQFLALLGEQELWDDERGVGVGLVPGNTSRWVDVSALSDEEIVWAVRSGVLKNAITKAEYDRLGTLSVLQAAAVRRAVHEGQGDEKLVLLTEEKRR